MPPKLAYTITEAAEIAGFSRSTLYKDIAAGKLETFRRARARRVTPQALANYVKLLENEHKAALRPPATARSRSCAPEHTVRT